MMATELYIYKEISSIPQPYKANAVYYVRIGTGVDIYVANSTGDAIFKHNVPEVANTNFVNVDGGSPTTSGNGLFKIDFGNVT